ncbi:oxidoreductase [Candida orthopsilosis Co 90-125]|uniref:Oxidoreductase n=1 Tax=Candida orthopsilosis (strain 90-125) TaxID=1136231 RepID=H8XAJ9_CANO9|nr:oxidoreductase [Candida orthopsilosis Co 90-125]CCG24849.1 oxidoreductase [Candida orthopsilosis Co 90-125]
MPTRSKFYNPETAHYYNPKTERKVVIITGGNSGIGWYTTLHLYLHGYVIYMAGRTESKVRKAFEDIEKEAQARITKEGKPNHIFGELHYIHIDLLDLSSVPKAVEEFFAAREDKLDVLINNAGIMAVPFEVTKDDYEIQYQVNFVAHFLLTLQLIPYLQKTVDAGETPRIINLSSIGHNFSYKYFKPENNKTNTFPNSIFTWVRYGIAKTAEIQITKEWAIKYPKFLSIAIHPGAILGTNLYDYWRQAPIMKYPANAIFAIFDKFMGVSNEEGALATLRAVMDPNLNTKKDNGGYLVTGGVFDKPSKVASNSKYAKQTWDWNIEQLEKRGFDVAVKK